jgi:hypothetical protein
VSERRIPVTVNGETVEVWPWARWRDAVTTWDPDAGAALSRGAGAIRDPADRPVDPDGRVVPEAHIRYAEAGSDAEGSVA